MRGVAGGKGTHLLLGGILCFTKEVNKTSCIGGPTIPSPDDLYLAYGS